MTNTLDTPIHYEPTEERSLWSAIFRGFRNTCPACGEKSLFASGLKTHESCPNCDEELFHHRADDLPAYLNIFIVGHVVVAVMMLALGWNILGLWPLTAVTVLIAILCALLLMRPIKGAVVGAQWALRMHGFGGHDD